MARARSRRESGRGVRTLQSRQQNQQPAGNIIEFDDPAAAILHANRTVPGRDCRWHDLSGGPLSFLLALALAAIQACHRFSHVFERATVILEARTRNFCRALESQFDGVIARQAVFLRGEENCQLTCVINEEAEKQSDCPILYRDCTRQSA